jgi:glycosyltransferase involved in cell wall biosynthesis
VINISDLRVLCYFEEGRLGGPQIYILRLAKKLVNQIYIELLVPVKDSKELCQQCEEQELKYTISRISRISKQWRVAIVYLLNFIPEIISSLIFIRNNQYDIVYVCGGSWQYKGVIAGKLAGKKVLWHLNDTYVPLIFRKVFSLFSSLADGYIYASDRTKIYYRPCIKLGKPEIVIPSPVDTEMFDPSYHYDGDEELLDRWFGKTVLGTICNVNPIKGLETFILAASVLNQQCDNLVFVVVGPVFTSQQNYFEQLQSLCVELRVDNIEFVGTRSDVRPLLARFNIYVCSSQSESSPIAVWEAMSMGKAIVSTDVGDVPLYVNHKMNGFIVDVGDAKKMSNYISELIRDDSLQLKFGNASREIAVSELDSSICAERHIEAFTLISHQIE